jgi:hypothetical protein
MREGLPLGSLRRWVGKWRRKGRATASAMLRSTLKVRAKDAVHTTRSSIQTRKGTVFFPKTRVGVSLHDGNMHYAHMRSQPLFEALRDAPYPLVPKE